MNKEEYDIEMRILEDHYNDFNFDTFQFFISFFEEEQSKKLMTDEYIKIAEENKDEVIVLKALEDVKLHIVEPVKLQYFMPQDERFFKNKTFIIDINNHETQEMMQLLRSITNHLVKKTQIKIHFLSKQEHIMECFAGSDFWEFRTKTFNYPAGDVNRIQLKENIEQILSTKDSGTKKPKI